LSPHPQIIETKKEINAEMELLNTAHIWGVSHSGMNQAAND
jgi:hypothetical protein